MSAMLPLTLIQINPMFKDPQEEIISKQLGGKGHCGGMEKLLLTSNFSFSHSVFKRLALQTCKNKGLFWKDYHGKRHACGKLSTRHPDIQFSLERKK